MNDLIKNKKDPETENDSFPETGEAEGKKEEILSPEKCVENLEKALEQSKFAVKEAEDRYLRSVAELDNFRKRTARETDEFRKYANMALVQKLLPSLDNMERAMASAEKESKAFLPIIDGLRLVLSDILKTFSEFHIQPIDAEGKPFDPRYHMAVAQEERDDMAPGTVVQTFQRGYIMHDRLIRPSMVSVAKAKRSSEEETEQKNEQV